jgi:phage baseplate assembly protein W
VAESVDIDVIGKGWHFPFQFDEDKGGVKTAEGVVKVGMAIQQILGTAVGERAWLRAFGNRGHDLVFEPIDSSLQSILEHYQVDALERWEKRIRIIRSTVDFSEKDDGRLLFNVDYQLTRTQRAGNVVFPLYLSEDEREERGLLTG